MIYLKPLIRRLTEDSEFTRLAEKIDNDKELLRLLKSKFSQEEIENAFLRHYGVQYKKPNAGDINEDIAEVFDTSLLREEGILPYFFEESANRWHFAISDLTNKDTQRNIMRVLREKNQTALFTFALRSEIEEVYQILEESVSGGGELEPNTMTYNAVEWVEIVINKGIELRASDIHIERFDSGIKVRYRVDGTLSNKYVFKLSQAEISNIHVRLKIIGNMNIVEKRRSQDGRIDDHVFEDKKYDLRVSTINTIHGEKFVMRIFDKDEKSANFADLGFSEEKEEEITKMIHKNNGIIYLAGATGAGKTTTLYAMIDKLDKEVLNIYTIENPVEKSVSSINQIQVDEQSGITYPVVLRTLLRQDPDIIVVGEIRDAETSELAVRASLTGHLVMTTIHANSALDSLSRLLDMGVESFLIGASSVGFISQRLVKKLCPSCRDRVDTLPEYQEMWIKEELPNFDYEKMKSEGKYFYNPKSCEGCIQGHKGRVAILEIITVDEELRSLISKKASTDEIKKYLSENGFTNMKEDGINKALAGIISIEELMGQLQN